MKPLRAVYYTIATALLIGGMFVSFIVYLQKMGLNGKIESLNKVLAFHNGPLFIAISVLIPFVLPAICLFIFLGLTEKDRTKTNVLSQYYKSVHHTNAKEMQVYGNLAGALWIFTFGIFVTVGFLWTWNFHGLFLFLLSDFKFSSKHTLQINETCKQNKTTKRLVLLKFSFFVVLIKIFSRRSKGL